MARHAFDSPSLYVGAAVYIVLAYLTLALGEGVARLVVPEDRYAEAVGALSFLAAGVLFLLAFLELHRARDEGDEANSRVKRLVLLTLAVLFVVACGEEISWGQRILGIDEPAALERINAQDELNVHNIEIGDWVVPYERLFDLLWLTFTVAIPLAALASARAGRRLERLVPVVHWAIGLLFVLNYLLAKLAKEVFESAYSLADVPFPQAVQEIKESNYALLFALAALCTYIYARATTERLGSATLPVGGSHAARETGP